MDWSYVQNTGKPHTASTTSAAGTSTLSRDIRTVEEALEITPALLGLSPISPPLVGWLSIPMAEPPILDPGTSRDVEETEELDEAVTEFDEELCESISELGAPDELALA